MPNMPNMQLKKKQEEALARAIKQKLFLLGNFGACADSVYQAPTWGKEGPGNEASS